MLTVRGLSSTVTDTKWPLSRTVNGTLTDRSWIANMSKKTRRCDHKPCDKPYRPKRSTSSYCSATCRSAARRAREKASGHVNRPRGAVDYTVLAQMQKPVEPEFYDGPGDKEYMDALMKEMVPNGVPRAARTPQRKTEREGQSVYITIHNVPTRFPGTPPRYGRQLTS